MSPLRVLIVGGGIAGPVAAFFLSKDGAADVTIVERASSLRTAGQNIDIRGTAADVIRAMGLEEEIRAKHSTEEGVSWVDAQNRSFVDFAANQSQRSFTADIEIVRSQLCRILYDATKDKVKYVFGEYVTAINQVGSDNGKAQVTLAKGGLQEYDIVIAADGLASKTRALMFPEDNTKDWVKPTGLYMSFFTIPKGETDTTWRRWYVASGSRGIMVRPDDTGTTRALLGTMAPDPRLEEVLRKPISEQRALLRDIFAGAGWETERILAGMDESSDFYMDKVAQIKMPTWCKGRVVLLGDAGYCPSPISGMGTSLALTGACVLAGEILKRKDDSSPAMAFESYEEVMRPRVDKAQKLAPGVPAMIYPQTTWGLMLLRGLVGFIGWSRLPTILQKFSGPSGGDDKLPEYGF